VSVGALSSCVMPCPSLPSPLTTATPSLLFFSSNATAPHELSTLSLHDALPISTLPVIAAAIAALTDGSQQSPRVYTSLASLGRGVLAKGGSAPSGLLRAPAARDGLGARARLVSRAAETSVPSCRPDMTMPGTAEAIPGICRTRPCCVTSRAPHPDEVVIRHVVHHRIVGLIAERLSGGRRHLVPGTERTLGRPHASVFGSLLEAPHLLDETCHAVALVAVDEPHLRRAILLQNEVPVLVASLLRRRRRDIQQLRKSLNCPHTIAPCVLQRGVDPTLTFSLQLGGLALLHLQLGLLLGDLRTQLLETLESGLPTHHIHSFSSTRSVLL